MVSRKKVYLLLIGTGIIITTIWYLPDHTWTVSYEDGTSGGGFGAGKKGLGISTKSWKSWSGAFVDEFAITYSSSEDARKDFEEELKGPGTVIERTESHDSSSEGNERAVKVFGPAHTKEGAATIIRLQGTKIYHVNAVSLKWALTFERSWLKLNQSL
jgi:hypothetical protein